MKRFINILKWDTVLMAKYGIVTIAFIISAIYCIALQFADMTGLEKVVAVLVFSDPVMYGFLFTAAMILFEKEAMTHLAIAVTPLPVSHYLLSKTVTFTLLAFICSTAIILFAHPHYFNIGWFISAVMLSSVLFIFIGVIGVSFVSNFNQFIILMPIVLAPTCLPFLSYFDVVSWGWLYLIPSQACLILFSASVGPVESWQLIYALCYLVVCIVAGGYFAGKAYLKQLQKSIRHA